MTSITLKVSEGLVPCYFIMVLAMPGKGAQHVMGYRDSDGDFLSGSKSCRLHVSANVPVVDYWSLAYYDADTRSLLDNGQYSSISSDRNLKLNPDGSADIFFGPQAPKDPKANWIKTIPGKGYFGGFHFYGPMQVFFHKTWKSGDIEKVK